MQPRKLQCCILRDSYQTESPIFVILCVICFQRQSFFTFISVNKITHICDCSLLNLFHMGSASLSIPGVVVLYLVILCCGFRLPLIPSL